MPNSKKVTKRIVKKRSSIKKLQKGRIREKNLFIIIAVLVVLIGAVALLKPWQYFKNGALPFVSNSIAVTKPSMDFGRARQMTLDPQKDNVMQVVTREKIRITLEVPKGAVKEKTNVQLIPFYHDSKNEAPTAGVAVGPGKVNFVFPVTLSFNLSDSALRNQAPKNVLEKKLHFTSTSQVLQIDSNAKSLTPTLIARGIETQTYLPARIITGGAYVFSFNGTNQGAIAKKALSAPKMNTLTTMESATALLFNDQQLSSDEMKKTKAAVAKILAKKSPPAHELYAALILQKKIKNKTFSLVPIAYAYETGEGFYQAVCRDDTASVSEYLGFAKAAQLMGYDSIGESCLNKAKNKIAEEAEKVIAGNSDLKSIMVALQNVQLVGLDGETNLEEKLIEKAKEVATEGAKKVADDPNSSALDAAIEMQKMESVGADNGPTYDKLKQKITDILDKQDAATDQATEEYRRDEAKREAEMDKLAEEAEKEEERLSKEYEQDAIDQEEILSTAVWSSIGIGMLKAFGFEELDQASLKAKFDEMQAQATEANEIGYSACLEMRAEGIDAGNCEEQYSKGKELLKEAEALSYRAETEIGKMQSQEFETPEYLDNNGSVELYFEEELTPTPGGEESVDESVEESGDEVQTEESYLEEEQNDGSYEQYDDSSYEEQSQDAVQEESYSGEDYDSGMESSSSEDVQGAHTKRFPWWPF